ncbi:DEAD/DEAH box helicase family protein [Hoeflea sp.]|uniref:BPTD_3080 family restriction endonuclease n=1 Tax=Hoeflea sp. TaxID=1940281 RepID=UPI00199D5597|nr:DEAD/DEAH box helicase family protein [Hoeflea sp.]MBC7283906.1 DEAD/DEAH box helicase family protein [Hoeflea sp.]
MSQSFFDKPILNSPYEVPTRHHALDNEGQPLDQPPIEGRRPCDAVTPVPKPKRRSAKATQSSMVFGDAADLTGEDQEYNPKPIINEIRLHVATWRALPNDRDWGVTPATARLLHHWRRTEVEGLRPFFCQVEAVETVIWLTEVARHQKRYAHLWAHIEAANKQSSPDLLRIAMKMATGAGKTTVMAMLIAWQAINAVRSPTSSHFSRGFLIVTPGITIRDRLRVLLPDDPDNYYRHRDLVPSDMLPEIGKAKVVITNYHAFKRRETMGVSKVGKALLQGRGDAPVTVETEGQMLQRACGDLMALKNVVVINDEAHHCYEERPQGSVEELIDADTKAEAEENKEAARLWINGIKALKRKVGVRAVYDLSATPFFLAGSGYVEGTLFPWVVSDFSLMDAIECGIVKLPRVPVADNLPIDDMPIYRKLWDHIGKEMPKKGAKKSKDLTPLQLPTELLTALDALYNHYVKVDEQWKRAGIPVPPVFIVVCNNTSTSKLIYEYISGWDRPNADGELVNIHRGHLELFRNYDEHGQRIARAPTLLIDSAQLESGEALDADFRKLAAAEIEQFRREKQERTGILQDADQIDDAELLREVMNTVGQVGRLGEQIRCVVSVSMLTEGWDANTVTHILGVRAFGTQLLCEQVVGRGLRRQSYELNEDGLFDVEYADVLGIPFDFTAKPVVVKPTPPKLVTRVHAVKERVAERPELQISFPRVEGYRVDLPDERLSATFTEDSRLVVSPEDIGPSRVTMSGIVGATEELTAQGVGDQRPSAIAYSLAAHLLKRFGDGSDGLPVHLFGQVRRIVREWLDGGYLVLKGVPMGVLDYLEIKDQAAERIFLACQRYEHGSKAIKAILDPYNPHSSSRHVNFTTSKDTHKTDPRRCHVSHVVCDSKWESELARVLETHPRVVAYVKNHGLGLEVPYRDGSTPRRYIPDMIVRLDDGHGPDDLLNLIIETKGYRKGDAQLKAETMKTLWVPGVNNLGTHGRWAFAEFTDVFEIEAAFGRLVEGLPNAQEAGNV